MPDSLLIRNSCQPGEAPSSGIIARLGGPKRMQPAMFSFRAHSFAVYTWLLESSSACHGGRRGCLHQVAYENPIQAASLIANGDAMPFY